MEFVLAHLQDDQSACELIKLTLEGKSPAAIEQLLELKEGQYESKMRKIQRRMEALIVELSFAFLTTKKMCR